ncbi:oligosaccharyltransferase complex subunit epsilon [Toensbergia leucococca]|nr:oligosaccharyltransferase complex subunit epsilon [Toensbergia leucococca]
MPPKRTPATPKPSTPSTTPSSKTPSKLPPNPTAVAKSPPSQPKQQQSQSQSPSQILQSMYDNYWRSTPQRVKLIDVFMVFLPFNAFLAGFSATVGQFVLTASLRIQTNPENKSEFKTVSHERAFADFILGSLILHFFCVNFIN